MNEIDIKYDISDLPSEIAPVYRHYVGQTEPQGAFIEMNENGVVDYDYDPIIGNAMPEAVYHDRTIRWWINPRTNGATIYKILTSQRVLALLDRVFSGQKIYYDGNNHRGELNDDARAASGELGALLDEMTSDDNALAKIYEMDMLFEYDGFHDLWPDGKSIDDAIFAVEALAREERAKIDDDDIRTCFLDHAEYLYDNGKSLTCQQIDALIADGRIERDEADQ